MSAKYKPHTVHLLPVERRQIEQAAAILDRPFSYILKMGALDYSALILADAAAKPANPSRSK